MDVPVRTGPIRVRGTLRKRRGDDPSTEPYETISETFWIDSDGSRITDPVRIAELEAKVQGGN